MTRLRELKESLAWIDDPTMTDGADPAARHWATECRSLLSDLERARALLKYFFERRNDALTTTEKEDEARAFLQEQGPSE
jgi:hypothetical protein